LIVAIGRDAPIEERYPAAVEIFHCTFDSTWDRDFDLWPDRWTRIHGPGFPHYVGVKIQEEGPGPKQRSVQIHLDGGGGAAESPPNAIPARALFNYVLEGAIKTKDLKYDRAYFSVTFLDENQKPLETLQSEKVHQESWKRLRLGPFSPQQESARSAVIGIHLEPKSPGKREDLHGMAWFGDIWLARLPKLVLGTGSPTGVFTDPAQIDITCTVSGFLDRQTRVRFQVEDVFGQNVVTDEQTPSLRPVPGEMAGLADRAEHRPLATGEIHWKPALPGPGFYRVRSMLAGSEKAPCEQVVTLVLVEPLPVNEGSEFSWSLPHGDHPLPLPALATLVHHAGVRWLKYPLWYGEGMGERQIDQFLAFTERLNSRGVEVVGILSRPQADGGAAADEPSALVAADVFAADPEKWQPVLEPLLTRVASQVHWWQLGHDRDTSFVGYPNLAVKVDQIRGALNRFGQDMNLGIGWGWMNRPPPVPGKTAPWRFLNLSTDPPLTEDELGTYLDGTADAKTERWVVMEPLPRSKYPVQVRAADLVRRIVAAKIHKAQGICVPDPFDEERGVMQADGTVGELFLAWRTAALLLGGGRYLGSLQLPHGSRNQVFAHADGAVMVVWNDRPTDETLYLGENLRQYDLWGRSTIPLRRPQGQVLKVDRQPTFVTGLHEAVARWRMDFALDHDQLPSIFGQGHENSFRLKNSFRQEVSGRVLLVVPEGWRVSPKQTNFHLGPNEELQQAFQISLPSDTAAGQHDIRIDFDIQADRPYQFSAYRRLIVGLGDISIQVRTQLDSRGELEVEQRLSNETGRRVNFRCLLFAPARRRQRFDLVDLPPGLSVHVYRLGDGKELIGRTLWIRAEEVGGPRVFNYRFPAER
jgi:hypothetical protein